MAGEAQQADRAELDELRREVAGLRRELRAQRRLQRLIAESHSAREDFRSSGQLDAPDPLRTRVAELETALRLVQLSRPYRLGRALRRAVNALDPLARRNPPHTQLAAALPAEDASGPDLPSGRGRPVVFFVPWLTYGGGGDQFVRDLAEALAGDGRTVAVVVTHGCPPELTDATAATSELVAQVLDLSGVAGNEDRLALCSGLLSRLDRPVIINVGSTWFYRHAVHLRAAAGEGATVIDQVFNHVGHVADDVAAGAAIDHTVVAHEALGRLLVEHYRVSRPVETIHVGLRRLGAGPTRTEPRRLPVVAWLGRLSSEKRAEWFVELAKALDGRARFLLAGIGPRLQEVERAARAVKSLELAGFVEDGVAFLDGADLLVLTSEVEGISVVAMEAVDRGVPVVSTDIGGMADLIEPGVNGELVSPDDPSELVAVIERLLDAPDELRALQQRTRETGLPPTFRLPAMIERYRALIA